MNSKSLLFIFALLALFTLGSTHAIAEKRDLEDDELLSDALSLMQKLLKSKEDKEKQRIAESLDTSDVQLEQPQGDLVPEINTQGQEKYIASAGNPGLENDQNNENIGPDFEEVEVITVTVEVDENGTEIVEIDTNDNQEADVAEGDVVEGDVEGEDVDAGVIGEDEQVNLNFVGTKNVVLNGELEVEELPEADPENDIGTVDYEANPEDAPKEEVTYYYEVDEGEYDESDDSKTAVINAVNTTDDEEKENNKSGVIGASVAVIGAFGVIAGLGYKYTQRNKRVLLPFHEDLEKGDFYDKNSAEQHIIPVWAATVKKEENEEEKEEDEKLFEVVYNYEPELPDELKLTVGDKIKIKEIYEDGWAYGYNKTTQLFGTFPSTSLGENFNPESVPQYKPEEVAVEMNDNMVEELKKKIVEESN